MRVLGYCLTGNHWHLALWPRDDGDLSRFMRDGQPVNGEGRVDAGGGK